MRRSGLSSGLSWKKVYRVSRLMTSPARAGLDERLTLESLSAQTDPQVVRRVLLQSLDDVIAMSRDRVRTSVDGKKQWEDPDAGSMLKAIELAAKITGAIGLDPDALLRFKGAAEELVRRASDSLRKKEPQAVQLLGIKATETKK